MWGKAHILRKINYTIDLIWGVGLDKKRSAMISLGMVLALLLGQRLPASQAQAPGSPVLLVTNGGYGAYLGEILRAEGLNSYDQITMAAATLAVLQQYDLVILGAGGLSAGQAADLRSFVNNGGSLLAVRPDAQIIDLFGLGASAGTLGNGYLKILNGASFDGSQPGTGLTAETLQIHGECNRVALAGGVMLAQLYSTASTSTAYPAVAAGTYGAGRAAAFLYDLPANIVLTRQGNPANANVDIDSDGVLRTIDLFPLAGGGTWVNLDRTLIPQADEQMRLFARLVRQLARRPLPQLWYFPDNEDRTMLILTADAHGNTVPMFQAEVNSLNAYGAKATFYMSAAGQPGDADIQPWRAQGHEFGVHPYKDALTNPGRLTTQSLTDASNWFDWTFSSPMSRTVRNHELAWAGYTDAVEIEMAFGMAFDTNYYHSGMWLKKADNSWAHGYITGSGLPMKFGKTDGTILPVYNLETHLVDEQMIASIRPDRENLSGAQGFAVSKQLIDASQAGFYSALMTQFHVDYYGSSDPRQWAELTMGYAQSQGIKMWNVDRFLNFTQTRHDASFQNLDWNETTGLLTFNLSANPAAGETLTTLIPLTYRALPLVSIQVDGGLPLTAPFEQIDVRGVPLAVVSLPSGNHSFVVDYETVYADLQASLAGPASAYAGDQVTYTLTVTDAGEDPATGVEAVFTLPGIGETYNTFNGVGWSCVAGGGTVTCDYSQPVAPMATAAVSIMLDVPAATRGALVVDVDVAENEADPILLNNHAEQVTAVHGLSDVSIALTGSTDAVVGGHPFAYTLHVHNAGQSTAENLTATLTLPAGSFFNSVSAAGWSCAHIPAQAKVACTLDAPLGIGDALPVTLNILAPASGANFQAMAEVTSASVDPNPGNNTASLTTGLIMQYKLFVPAISKAP